MEPRHRQFLEQDHDLVVVGGGVAGRVAARVARWSGARVALVTGPAAHDGDRRDAIPHLAFVLATRRSRDFGRAIADARGTVSALGRHDTPDAMRAEGIDVVEGRASFAGPGEILAGEVHLRSGRFVIATGSRPNMPSIAGLDRVRVLTADELGALTAAPASVAVVGGGATGCELAQALARTGVAVVLFEQRERLLPAEEAAAARLVTAALRRDGIDIRVGSRVRAVEPSRGAGPAPGGARVLADRGEPVEVEQVLVASGRAAHTGGLDLAAAGVMVDARGFVQVDRHLRTSARGTYGAGDVTGLAFSSHAAAEMGRLAAGHALKHGARSPFRARHVPRMVLTDPEVAAIGVAEHEAPRWARVAEVPFAEVARAVAEGTTEGYCTLVALPRLPTGRMLGGRLAGATIVAPNAADLVAEISVAMTARLFPARLANAVHARPTMSAAVQECAMQLLGESGGRRARRPQRS